MDGTETLRRFNRTYTQRIGALDESFLGTGTAAGRGAAGLRDRVASLGKGGATVRELRDRLDLDSGYLSRLLRTLEERGLVEVRPDRSDRRRRWVTLTASGPIDAPPARQAVRGTRRGAARPAHASGSATAWWRRSRPPTCWSAPPRCTCATSTRPRRAPSRPSSTTSPSSTGASLAGSTRRAPAPTTPSRWRRAAAGS